MRLLAGSQRYKLIACEVMQREFCAALSSSRNAVDIEFLPKGLHDLGAEPMLRRLQAVVDKVEEGKYSAIILGYALCNNGLHGLTARHTPLVLPRAHDCITLFLGSKERYLTCFNSRPGTYFETTGWMERGESEGELSQISIQRQVGLDRTYQELVEKYGEDNAKYLYEMLGDSTRNYRNCMYIDMGVGPEDSFAAEAQQKATERGWTFERVPGNMRLIKAMVDGDWDPSDFVVAQPGERIVASYTDGIVKTAPSVGVGKEQ